MRLVHCSKAAALLLPLVLGACAPGISASDLSRPNYGRQVLPHFDASLNPDPANVANGLYAVPPTQNPCWLAYSRCSGSQFAQSSWQP